MPSTEAWKLVLVFAVLSAGCFAAGFFLTRYLVDSHYLTISVTAPPAKERPAGR
jgi:hypothetical protein